MKRGQDESLPEFIGRWLAEKPPEMQDTICIGGRLLWPETLKRRVDGGRVIEEKCMIRVPTALEKAQAVLETNKQIAEAVAYPPAKRPLTRVVAEEILGPAAYGEMHCATLMAFAIRSFEAPHGAMYHPTLITKEIPLTALYDLFDRLDLYADLEDVRISQEINQEMFDAIVVAVARSASTGPLAVCDGARREQLIVRMAKELAALKSPTPAPETSASSSESSETSTPD